MFESIINFFKGSTAQKANDGYSWLLWHKNASAKEKKEKIKFFDEEFYDWVIKAEKYITEKKINEIVDFFVYNHIVNNFCIPEMQDYIKFNTANNPDTILLEIEKQKLKILDEMNWRDALNK